MKISNTVLTIATIMLIIAIVFVVYAFGHPELSFSIPLSVVKTFYKIYAITTIVLFVLGLIFKIIEKKYN